jgi:hypothetical protein
MIMTPKEKLLAQKLLKIATNQQKIIQRLAQQTDPNIEYLRNVVQVAGANANPPVALSAFIASKGQTGGYTVTVDGFPPVNDNNPKDVQRDNASKMSFKKNFDNQLQAQNKANLMDSLAIIYKNKPAGVA